jgi:hypothetical protein
VYMCNTYGCDSAYVCIVYCCSLHKAVKCQFHRAILHDRQACVPHVLLRNHNTVIMQLVNSHRAGIAHGRSRSTSSHRTRPSTAVCAAATSEAPTTRKVSLVSLGCPKNVVDGE